MSACTFCQKDIPDAARACPHCNRDVRPATGQVAPRSVAPPPAQVASVEGVPVVDPYLRYGKTIGFVLKLGVAAAVPALVVASCGVVVAAVMLGRIIADGIEGKQRATAAPAAVAAPVARTRAQELRGLSSAEVVMAIGPPSFEETGVLTYRSAKGDKLRLVLEKDHVASADPNDFDLTTIPGSR